MTDKLTSKPSFSQGAITQKNKSVSDQVSTQEQENLLAVKIYLLILAVSWSKTLETLCICQVNHVLNPHLINSRAAKTWESFLYLPKRYTARIKQWYVDVNSGQMSFFKHQIQ